MAKIELNNVTEAEIGANDTTVRADLSLLDDYYDFALVSFEYGQEPDLSDGSRITDSEDTGVFETAGSVTDSDPEVFTSSYDEFVDLEHQSIYDVTIKSTDGNTTYEEGTDYELNHSQGSIKVLSSGNMADTTDYHAAYDYGVGVSTITGLTEGTEYYYKAIGKTLAYNSQQAMDLAADNEGAMNSITDNEMAVTEALSYVVSRTKMLSSPYAIDTIWSSEMASQYLWEQFTPNPVPSYEFDSQIDVSTILEEGRYILKFNDNGSSETTPEYDVSLDIDFTSINTLKIKTAISCDFNDTNYGYFYIDVGIQRFEEIDTTEPHSLTERSYDVSGINGEKELKIGHASTNDVETQSKFADIILS